MKEKKKQFKFYLDSEMKKELDKIAAQMGVSKSKLIRAGVKRILQEKTKAKNDPIWGIVGMGHSGVGKVSTEHDRYLAEIKLRKMHR